MADWDVAIMGGGPAGLMAATRAAQRGRKTILLDKNREPGVKILLSGGTRCNLTHATDARGIVEAFGPGGRFLHSALAALGPEQVVELFEAEGVPTKIEPGGKVFPRSDRAADVRAALLRLVRRSGCTLAMAEPLVDLVRTEAGFRLITPQRQIECRESRAGHRRAIVSGLRHDRRRIPLGGRAGPSHRAAAHGTGADHNAMPPGCWRCKESRCRTWSCAMIVDPQDRCQSGRRCESRHAWPAGRGAMLLSPISGVGAGGDGRQPRGERLPAAQHAPAAVRSAARRWRRRNWTRCWRARALAAGKRRVAALLDPWLPHRVGETLVALAGMPPERPAAEFSKAERRRLVQAVKRLDIPVAGTMGFRKAEVTAGGVCAGGGRFADDAEQDRARIFILPANCSISTARWAATTSRPRSAPAGSPGRACRKAGEARAMFGLCKSLGTLGKS